MKVIFINPTPGYGFLEKGIKRKRRIAGFFPPLGIAYLATVLENAGHTCKVLDLQVSHVTKEQLLNEIKGFQAEAICISVLTALAPEAFRIAKAIKEEINIPIICGGHHVSLFPKEVLTQIKDIDYIVYGEGEYKLLELITALENKKDLSKVKGIFFRHGNKIIETEKAPIIENLDELPIPSREFFDLKRYLPVSNQYKRMPVTNMITSRGCTYGFCKFCSESGILHNKFRRYSVDRAIAEVKYLIDNYTVKEIYFWDDEFVLGNTWVEEFCDRLIEEKLDLTWACYAKVNYVNPKILKKMASAGCWNIFYGVESGNQDLLNNINKGQTIEQIRKAVQWTKDAGIEVKGSFMLGLPGETPEKAMNTINFAIELDLDYPMFALTTPYPGTKLYDEFVKEGGKNMDFSKYTCFVPVYLPKGYENREQLIKLHKLAYRKCYLRYGYFKRRLKAINSVEDIKRYIRGVYFLFKMKLLDSPGL